MSDYTYKETEPYEKGFASHYLKTVVPVLDEARERHTTAVRQLRLRIGVVVGLVILAGLAWVFGFIETARFVGRSGDAMGIAAVAVLAVVVLFVVWPYMHHRSQIKTLVVPRVLEFFGPYSYTASGGVDRKILPYVFPGMNSVQQEDRISGEHRGRRFEFAEAKVTKSEKTGSSDSSSHTVTLFDGVVLHVRFPRVPSTTHVVKDRGGFGNFLEGIERAFIGLRKVPLGNAALENEYEVYANDEAVARMLVGEELIGATGEFAELIGASRLAISFFGTSFVLKIETGVDFFEPGGLGGNAFGPRMAKQFVREIHTLLTVVEAAGRIADEIAERADDLMPEGFTEDIVENDDGTFSVHGRTYKSRETAEAYLEHYG